MLKALLGLATGNWLFEPLKNYQPGEKANIYHKQQLEYVISKLNDTLSFAGFQIGVCRVVISWKAQVVITATLSAIY
jgi:hypothetical protein